MNYKADQSLKSNARINPSTRAMELAIPIGGYQGRAGNGLPIVFNYSSKVWQIHAMGSWEGYLGIRTDSRPMYAKRTAAGWTSNLGSPVIDFDHVPIYEGWHEGANYEGQVLSDYVSINPDPNPPNYLVYYVKRLHVTLPDGSSHEFRANDNTIACGSNQSGCSVDMTGTFLSVDGSRMRLEIGESEKVLYMSNGDRYFFGTGYTASVFIDRNGNKMLFDVANRRWTDTLGRIVNDPFPFNWDDFEQNQTVGDVVANFPWFDGGTTSVTLSWRYLKDPGNGESGLLNMSDELHNLSDVGCQGNINRDLNGPYLFNQGYPVRVCHPITWSGLNWTQGPPFNPVVLTKITLANGQKYEFKYNVYGEIVKVIYPTGSYERFSYGKTLSVQQNDFAYDQANRGVLDRYVSVKGDGTDETHWHYDNASWTTTVPDGTRTEQSIFTENADAPQPFGFGNAKTGQPNEERSYSSANQLLARKLTSYETTGALSGGYADATRDLRPSKQVSIQFEPGSSYAIASMTTTVYDTAGSSDPAYFSALNPKQQKIYNYIVLDLTTAQYSTIEQISALFTNSNLSTITEMDYLYDPSYKARNINGLVTETRVKDASGNLKAKSQIAYDTEALLTDVSSTRWQNPNTNYRGLVTSTKSWSDIAANQFVETRAQYDQLGNLRNSWDARNNLTQTTYSSTYDHAYPTSVTTPVPDTSGTHGSNAAFTTSTVYDFNTGLPTSTTDINGQTTTMEYNDALLRPTKVTAPNGHQTITEYGLGTTASTRFVKVKSQIDETNWKEGYTWYDGLARTIKTQSVDDDGDVFALTCYDNMSRVAKVSNPFRGFTDQDCSTANGTLDIYWTTNTFDTSGRPWKVTTPDNAVVETTYDLATSGSHIGTVVTVKDQALKQRRSVTNALGQLVRVDEPDATSGQLGSVTAPNQPTNYAYDTLNNLTTVNQDVQTRTFVYDSFGRLKSATNPESGTITYGYDNNGNLTTKTDARNITTTYAYDALNRVKTRTYSDGTTPSVNYFYDNLTNAKGKLIKVTNSVSTTEYTSFDILGRVTGHKQTTDGTAYTTGYTYNLVGALIEETYPSGRVVKNTLDNSGDLQQVQSREVNDTFRNYANGFVYAASGAVTSMRLGNGKFESTQFNSRLQPTQISLGSSVGNTNLLKLNYGYGTIANNGNVLSQTITVPGLANPFIQTYQYDSLNRLASAAETNNNSQTWNQVFGYDRYGNRNISSGIGQTNLTFNGNRITTAGYSYDSTGNTTADPSGKAYTYNAENKQTLVNGGSVGQYFYDGDGKRVKKIVPSTGETTVFVYDATGKSIAEYSTNVANSTDAKVAYLTSDHLGSPRINTDQNGTVIARHDYLPYGEEIIALGSRSSADKYVADDVRQGFTGYERDIESSLDFAQARMFSFSHGRFTSPDDFRNDTQKEDPSSWNLYVYVRNNPLNATDPSGEILQLVTIKDKDGKEVNQINDKNRAALLGWLNHTYGCDSCVTINKNNQIQLDASKVSKEVLAVTKDLTDAINDKNHIAAVVGYEGNANVNFAKAISGNDLKDPLMIGGKKADAILVDFKDFRGLNGGDAAVSAFTNYAFVHEVFHLFPSLTKDDISDKDVTGPVENRVNEIRQVRGDLLRATYSAESDNGIFGSMWFGPAKIDKKTGLPKRNINNGIIVESKKMVSWNLRMTGN